MKETRYFVSFQLLTQFGPSVYSCVIDVDFKIDSEENLNRMEQKLKEWKAGNVPANATLIFFKEIGEV